MDVYLRNYNCFSLWVTDIVLLVQIHMSFGLIIAFTLISFNFFIMMIFLPSRFIYSFCYFIHELLTVIAEWQSALLLFSSRVPRPSLVTLCSHKSGRCAVELYHASHLWYPPFYTSPMASSALQHWTASLTKEGCHWQAGGENCQACQLANPVKHVSWPIQPDILNPPLLRLTSRKPLWLDLQPVDIKSR